MKTLSPEAIVPMNAFQQAGYPIETDLVYAQPDHPNNNFKNLYHSKAEILWAHEDMAAVTLLAARIANYQYGWFFKLNDCLRPVEGQEGMEGYHYDERLVSKPGTGAHPRGMAMDIEPKCDGELIWMGTEYDHFAPDPDRDNPAARNAEFSYDEEIQSRRKMLTDGVCLAGETLGHEILPLADEWWDFRFTKEEWGVYAPLREKDLLPCQRVINVDIPAAEKILAGDYPDFMKAKIAEIDRNVEGAFQALLAHGKLKPQIQTLNQTPVPVGAYSAFKPQLAL